MKIRNLIAFLLLIIFSVYSPVFARRDYNRQKACFSNQRVLQGAVEMYNMDHDVMLHEVNEGVIELLKKGKYIKDNHFFCPTKNEPGHYLSQGDLCEDGVIYCDYHGSVAGDGNGPIVSPSKEYQMDQHRSEFRNKMNSYLPIITVIAFFAVIILLFSGNKKKR